MNIHLDMGQPPPPVHAHPAGLNGARQAQLAASDPAVSAWVNANAGTGKTYVLVQRILRLLLSGAKSQSLLCLTYTKNAAAEMEARVLKELGRWATATQDELDAWLGELLNRAPDAEERKRARCLFGEITDAARGLPIMTIHSFCEQLLRRFPVEAGIAPDFAILTEDEARIAFNAATDAALDEAARDPGSPPGVALSVLARHADETQFGKLLAGLLAMRGQVRALLAPPSVECAFDVAEVRLRRLLGLHAGDTVEGLRSRQLALCDETAACVDFVDLLRQGGETDRAAADAIATIARSHVPDTRLAALRDICLTKEGKPRQRLLTKPAISKTGPLAGRLTEIRDALAAAEDQIVAAKSIDASMALLRIAARIFDLYEREKRKRCTADFEDLIEKTLSLLGDAPSAQWVLFQLDARIDHILVDEAQDTSAAQWAIIDALAGDFFAGESARDTTPTIFAVGDVKQSIYSFQGAEPRLMMEQERAYAARVAEAGLEWRSLSLGLSFRSTAPILNCVDKVWSRIDAQGDAAGAAAIPHTAHRAGLPGFVEIWSPEKPAPRAKGETWSPENDEEEELAASVRLSNRIADDIAGWLARDEPHPSKARAIRPGDILILVKKRNPMLDVLLRALSERSVPVAGADRIALLDSLAVMDLIALGSALAMPEDDLTLACALKSPLFGLDDNDLLALAAGREGSLRTSLHAKAAESAKFAEAHSRLARWAKLALSASPAEFYHRILDGEDLRLAFTARLGMQCVDEINAFLDLAETFGERSGGTLSSFLVWVQSTATEVKRDAEQQPDAVRVMTVHGAKGLEADIVFLADTCRADGGRASHILSLRDGLNLPPLPLWLLKGADRHPVIAEAKTEQARLQREEAMRLLYVAMTRARDRLYVAGFQNRDTLPDGCWYDVVFSALGSEAEQLADTSQRPLWRIVSTGSVTAPPQPAPEARQAGERAAPLPRWAKEAAPREAAAVYLSPSSFPAMPHADAEELVDDSGATPHARLAGVLIHRLLQHLPEVAPDDRMAHAHLLLARFPGLSDTLRDRVIAEALAVLADERLSALFNAPCLVEAALAARMRIADGQDMLLLGQADRIIVDSNGFLILDYKTSRAVPASADSLPRHYLAQLGAYRATLMQIFPGQAVRAAVLFTKRPLLLECSGLILDTVMADLRRQQVARS